MYVQSKYMYVHCNCHDCIISYYSEGSLRCHLKHIEIIALLDCKNSKALMVMVFRCVI